MTTMANTTPSVDTTVESAPVNSITTPLTFDAALLRGRENEFIVSGWDDEAMIDVQKLQASVGPGPFIVAVHPGSYHVDELVAIAMTELILDVKATSIIRSRNLDDVTGAHFVMDTCEGLLDHHGVRNDGHSCAATRIFKILYNTDEIREAFSSTFWQKLGAFCDRVAAQDNGKEMFDRMGYVHAQNKLGVVSGEDTFDKALNLVRCDLEAMLYVWDEEAKAADVVNSTLDANYNADVVVFPPEARAANAKEIMWYRRHPAIYYISPESESDWRILCCAPPRETEDEEFSPFKSRFLLPEQWRSKRGEELSAVSKVPGAIFCHAAGFIAGWQTKEGAVQAAERAIRILKGEEDA